MKYPSRIVGTALLAALLPLAAQAHPGHEAHAGFVMGMLHPFTGWDHLAVLLCLGALVAGRGLPLALRAGSLLAAMLAGGAALGLAFPHAGFVEPAILVTVLASALLLRVRARLGGGVLLTLCLAFTLVHGMAHGQEAPTEGLAAYFAGFTLAGTVIYAAGVALAGALLRSRRVPSLTRVPSKSG
jgi:urease accessory protein